MQKLIPPRGHHHRPTPLMPDARWMYEEELDAYGYESGGILLGRNNGNLVGVRDDRHLMTIAGSRSGKSSTVLIPNLKTWTGSVMTIDPKGELATKTARDREKMGQDVIILDPFGEVKDEAVRKYRRRFDPLSEILAAPESDIIDNAALVAEALITPMDGNKPDHWSMSARNLVRGLILWAFAEERQGNSRASLNKIRQWITLPLEETDDPTQKALLHIFDDMMKSEAFDDVVAGVGGTMAGKPDGERGSIISTAVEQTAFLDSSKMIGHLSDSEVPSLRVLKQRPTTIYLVLPASRMATHFRWLRLILTLAMAALENEPNRLPFRDPDDEQSQEQVLFILEEFPQLGYMRQIEAAAGLMAGYGVKIWTVLQDLSQIKSLYRSSWETFFGNAGVVQAFGNTDATTLEYISRALGTLQVTEMQNVDITPKHLKDGGFRERENLRGAPLMAPFEVALHGAREHGHQIIIFAGKRPAFIQRLSHMDIDSMTTSSFT